MRFYSAIALLMVATPLTTAQSAVWLGKFDWAVVTPLQSQVIFNCALQDNETDVLPVNTSVLAGSEKWLLPGDDRFYKDSEGKDNKVVNMDKLRITNITMEDKGIYLCHVELTCDSLPLSNCSESDRWFKHGLNMNGPLYASLMEKYRINFIMGSAAGGAVLALFLLVCSVYKLRYKEEGSKPEDSDDIQDATGGAKTGGAKTGGSETGGSETGGAETGGAKTGGAKTGGSETGGAETGGVTITHYYGPDEANTNL